MIGASPEMAFAIASMLLASLVLAVLWATGGAKGRRKIGRAPPSRFGMTKA
jgi:hypothetical protein